MLVSKIVRVYLSIHVTTQHHFNIVTYQCIEKTNVNQTPIVPRTVHNSKDIARASPPIVEILNSSRALQILHTRFWIL